MSSDIDYNQMKNKLIVGRSVIAYRKDMWGTIAMKYERHLLEVGDKVLLIGWAIQSTKSVLEVSVCSNYTGQQIKIEYSCLFGETLMRSLIAVLTKLTVDFTEAYKMLRKLGLLEVISPDPSQVGQVGQYYLIEDQ